MKNLLRVFYFCCAMHGSVYGSKLSASVIDTEHLAGTRWGAITSSGGRNIRPYQLNFAGDRSGVFAIGRSVQRFANYKVEANNEGQEVVICVDLNEKSIAQFIVDDRYLVYYDPKIYGYVGLFRREN